MRRLAAQLGLRLAASALPKAGAVIIAIGGGDLGRADVLYDTTDAIENGTYFNGRNCLIGGFAHYGEFRDEQICDDIELDGSFAITSVTGAYLIFTGTPFPAGGVLVEFFPDLAGTPSETPFAAALSTDVVVTPFRDIVFGSENTYWIVVDLSASGINLGPGIWWVSIVPVDETPDGARNKHLHVPDLAIGGFMHGRAGGVDHGNGYPGPTYGSDDWLSGPGNPLAPGSLVMKIEGTPVKPDCPQDLDGNGSVGASDLLSLLASWGPCKGCSADFDGNGSVGASDLLALLASWGPCP